METATKVIVIDTATQTLRYDTAKDYKDLQKLCGPECRCISAPVELDNGDTIYSDDEGLLNTIEGGFMMAGWSYPIANGVLQGCNDEGESVDVKTTIEELAPQIIWVSKTKMEEFAEQFR